MSRIGKKPIEVPAGVTVTIKDRTVTVAGPKGTLAFEHRPEVRVAWEASEKRIVVTIDEADMGDRVARQLWGTTRAILRNLVLGVTKGFEKSMEVVGVGWTAEVQGQRLKLSVGFASPVMLDIPKGLSVSVERGIVKIAGVDKQAVGQFAAEMRARRKPEPYNGKGIKYAGEVIRRKQGKQFGA